MESGSEEWECVREWVWGVVVKGVDFLRGYHELDFGLISIFDRLKNQKRARVKNQAGQI